MVSHGFVRYSVLQRSPALPHVPVGYHPSHLLITSHCVGKARAMSDQRSLPVAIVFPWATRHKSQASQAQSHDGGAL
eukprot:13676210-Alexandrium_andersonii.AAC.1